MNTLKIGCGKNDYIIKTAKANSENELKVEVPEYWNCDYVNAVLWEDDICEILENNKEQILLIPRCGEMLLRMIHIDDEMHYISIPVRYENMKVVIIKI